MTKAQAEALLTDLEGKYGKTLNGQITISYLTRQTAEQYLEILSDNGEDFDEDNFLEYVVSNVAEQIQNEVRFNGGVREDEIVLLTDTGEQVN